MLTSLPARKRIAWSIIAILLAVLGWLNTWVWHKEIFSDWRVTLVYAIMIVGDLISLGVLGNWLIEVLNEPSQTR